MSKTSYLAAGVCVASLLTASAAFAAPAQIYGTYTDNVTNVTQADNGPSIDNNGLPQGDASYHEYFTVSGLSVGGQPKNASQGNGLLFTVDPNRCLDRRCDTGTETADINVNFDFYSATGALLGTMSDTALATFIYGSHGDDSDNLCWLDGSVGGSAVVSHSAQGTCFAANSGKNPTGFEQIAVSLNGSTYNVDLHDWNDWDEQPDISFQLTCTTNCSADPHGTPVPEPLTLSLFGAGLAGAAAIRRRKKKAA